MNKLWPLFFGISFLLISFGSVREAQALSCSDPNATWNHDEYLDPSGVKGLTLNPTFSCKEIDMSQYPNIPYVVPAAARNACSGTSRCVRSPDCVSALKGRCVSSSSEKAKLATTHREVKMRCSGDASNTCWVPKKIDPPPDDLGDPAKSLVVPESCDSFLSVTSTGGPKSGGSLTTNNRITMPPIAGSAGLSWEFYSVPDRIEVKDASGAVIASSGETASIGAGSLAFNFQPGDNPANNFITVVVYATNESTWDYSIDCPDETPFLQPTETTETTDSAPVVRISDCCRQIVPNDDAEVYANGNYGLNHFVQVAINVYECILCMIAALMLLMFVVGGFIFMTSTGNPARIGTGKKIIIGAVIGGIIVFASILIVNFSIKALGGSFIDETTLKVSPGK